MRQVVQGLILAALLPLASCHLIGEGPSSLFVFGTADQLVCSHPLMDAAPPDWASLVFSRLYTIDLDGRAIPDLVREDRISPDGRKWTLDLKPDITWHDGHRFSAADVIFTLRLLFDPQFRSDRDQKLALLSGFTAAGDSRIELELSAPWPDLRQALVEVPILPAHRLQPHAMAAELAPDDLVGTGPYRLRERHGEDLSFERNDSYFGRRPAIQRLVVRYLPDDDARARAVHDGTIDLAVVKPSSVSLFGGSRAHVYRMQSGLALLATLNLSKPPLVDRRLRQALSLLVDREAFVEQVLDGAGMPLVTPIPPGCACRIEPAHGVDADRARTLLDEAGHPDIVPLSLDLLVPRDDAVLRRASEALAQQLQQRGVNVVRLLLGEDQYALARRQPLGTHDAILQTFESNHSAGNFLRYYVHSRGRGNPMGFQNAELDALIERLSSCRDENEQDGLCARLQELLQREAPVLSLASPQVVYASRTVLSGLNEDEVFARVDLAQLVTRLAPIAGS